MRIFKDTTFEVGHLVWQSQPRRYTLTLVVKATFAFVPATPGAPLRIADEQTPCSSEAFYDDESGTVRLDSDMALVKGRAECWLAGTCHAPGAVPARTVLARFVVGRIDKPLLVIGDRESSGLLGATTEPRPFTTMPLRWERAYGGPSVSENPVGRGASTVTLADGRKTRLLPNIEDPAVLRGGGESKEPWGAFPIPSTWKARLAKAGTFDERWKKTRWPWFPEDFDARYFNAAPEDQRIEGSFVGDERIRLEGLHPTHAKIDGVLPGLRARCFVARRTSKAIEEVALRLDTIGVDADALRVHALFRGVTTVANEDLDDVLALYVVEEPVKAPKPTKVHEDALAAHLAALTKVDDTFAPEAPRAAENVIASAPVVAAPLDLQALRALLRRGAPGLDEGGVLPKDSLPSATPMAAPSVPTATVEAATETEPPAVPASSHALALRRQVEAARANGESLAGLVLFGAALGGLDLRGADLRGAVLADANLEDARLDGADLRKCDLTGAHAKRASFDGAHVEGATFEGADLTFATFRNAKASRADFARARADDAMFEGALLERADFSFASFARARFRGAMMASASIEGASGVGASFDEADLTKLRASEGPQLSGATFVRARAPQSTWDRAVLEGADFSYTDLERADFHAARLAGVKLNAATLRHGSFRDAILPNANALRADAFEATFERADLTAVDFRGANLFSAELLDAKTERTDFDLANLKRTKLARGS